MCLLIIVRYLIVISRIVSATPQSTSSRHDFSRDPFEDFGRLRTSDREEINVAYPAGSASSLIWPSHHIRHCKWIPAFAGMKRSGGDARSTGDTVLQAIRFPLISECRKANNRLIWQSVISASGFVFYFWPLIFALVFPPKSEKPISDIRKGSLSMEKSNPFQHTVSKVFSINPGTAGPLALIGTTYLVTVKNQKSAMLCGSTALRGKVFWERCGKHFFSKKGFPRKSSFLSSFHPLFFPFLHSFPITISRSGRRGRMRRHMRDNMASRVDRSGNLFAEGGRCPCSGISCNGTQNKGRRESAFPPYNATCSLCCVLVAAGVVRNLFAEDFSLPLSSPGVCCTNPPSKPTGKFTKPNRQWCGAWRGGGEGSPRARVSFEQQERTFINPSAIFAPVADRQQRDRSSKHRRAASSTARTSGLLEKRHEIHIREDQQNMGTGNAVFMAVPVPVFAAIFFNRPVTPFRQTARAGVAC